MLGDVLQDVYHCVVVLSLLPSLPPSPLPSLSCSFLPHLAGGPALLTADEMDVVVEQLNQRILDALDSEPEPGTEEAILCGATQYWQSRVSRLSTTLDPLRDPTFVCHS